MEKRFKKTRNWKGVESTRNKLEARGKGIEEAGNRPDKSEQEDEEAGNEWGRELRRLETGSGLTGLETN